MQVEATPRQHAASLFDRIPAPGLVLTGIATVQIGAASATKLFDDLGPAGTVLLRVAFAAGIPLALFRPNWRGYKAGGLPPPAVFGPPPGFLEPGFFEGPNPHHPRIPRAIEVLRPPGLVV